jgi:hypothetical protein
VPPGCAGRGRDVCRIGRFGGMKLELQRGFEPSREVGRRMMSLGDMFATCVPALLVTCVMAQTGGVEPRSSPAIPRS